MTIGEIITKCNIGEEHLTQEEYEQVAKWLEENKNLREELKAESESIVLLTKELEAYKKAYQMVCDSLSDKTVCNWGYDDACKACQEDLDNLKTTSCVGFIKKYYLQKAREENV